MTQGEWVQLTTSLLGAACGSAIVVAALATWFASRGERAFREAEEKALASHRNDLAQLLELHRTQLAAALEAHRAQLAKELEAHRATLKLLGDVDVDLRQRRLDAFRPLWQSTSILPRFPRPSDALTYRDLDELSESLTRWYYEKGGMLLPRSAVDGAFLTLQQEVVDVVEPHRAALDAPVDAPDFDRVRRACSALRAALTDTILGRREAPVDGAAPK